MKSAEQDKRTRWARKASLIAALCCTAVLVAGIPLGLFREPEPGGSVDQGIMVITAFAADGEEVALTHDVKFTADPYQLTMSSVPGLPFEVVCPEADSIRVTVTEGGILTWDPDTFKVIRRGTEHTIRPGDTVYWTPQRGDETGFELREGYTSNVLFTAFQGDAIVAKGSFFIEGITVRESGKLLAKGYSVRDVVITP